MSNMKFTAVLALAGFAFSTTAFAQDSVTPAAPEVQADAETLATAEKINTPSTEGVVTDEASCTYEGGSVETLQDGTACFIQIRGEEAATQIYDGMGMGVIRCSGNGTFPNEISSFNDSYCYVYMTEKKAPKTRAELEAELEAMTQRELESTN
ncbi:MAG: hypothetical protein ACSHX3_12565 [Litorimonas sp.]